jgi:hypothetical protein
MVRRNSDERPPRKHMTMFLWVHTWSADGQRLLAPGPGGQLRLSGHTTMTCTLFALLLRLPRNGTLDFAGPGTIDTSTE